jgi:hypothetical protein
MRRVILLAVVAATAGCNSILDIPERSLLVDEDTGSLAIDSTVDSELVIDTALGDSNIEDTTTPDAVDVADSLLVDVSDSSTPDTSMTDSAAPDSVAPDSMMPDTTMTDSAMTDSAMADTRDSAASDTATPDTGSPTCGVTGKPCCGSPTAATCDTTSVCSSTGCIAAAGSCVRATDCPGVCTGPAICAGSICFTCGAAAGTGTLWSTCTSATQCATGPCDTIRGVCASACAPGITGDADCTALDPKAVCTAPNYTVTSGPSMASGNPGFCARSCKKDGDCRVAESCRIVGNNVIGRLDLTCSPAPSGATVDPDGACTSSSQCKRGTCLTLSGVGKCTPLCVNDADCTGTWTRCNDYSFPRPGGGTQIVRVCGT